MTWTTTRLKFLAAVPIRNGIGEAGTQDDPSWPRYIRTTDIAGPRTLRDDMFASLPPEIAAEAPVTYNDLLMSAAGSVGKTILYVADGPACYAGYLVRFRAKADVDPRFVAYWTETPLFLDQIEVGKVRSTIDNFSAGKYQNLRLSVPSLAVQSLIADYLDVETARIDALVEKKRRLVDLVNLRFRSLVMRLIFKDTSRQWVSLSRLCHCLPGFAFSSDDFVTDQQGGVRLLRGANVSPGSLRWDEVVYLPRGKITNRHQPYALEEGDIVLGMDRPLIGTGMRVASVTIADLPALLVQRVARLRANELSTNEFLGFLLQSDAFAAYFTPITTGVSVPHISEEQILAFRVPFLSHDEQSQVVQQLAVAKGRHAAATKALNRQIVLVGEHRQALITAAVAGELDIPGVAA